MFAGYELSISSNITVNSGCFLNHLPEFEQNTALEKEEERKRDCSMVSF